MCSDRREPVGPESDDDLGIEVVDYNLGAVGLFLAAVALIVFAVFSAGALIWEFIFAVIRGGGW